MKVIWKQPLGKLSMLIPIFAIGVFIIYLTISLVINKTPFSIPMGIFVFAAVLIVSFLISIICIETYEVDIDDGRLYFRRLIGTVKVSPEDISEIRMQYSGITMSRIIVETTNGILYFWGKNSGLVSVITRIFKRKWDISTRTGCLSLRLPDDDKLWDLFVYLQNANPQLKITDPYLFEQVEHRKQSLCEP